MNDTSNPAAHVAIDIAGPLKCKPDDVVKYVVVKVGDDVEEHGLLAQKNSFFGKTEIKSPMAGVVVNIETDHGTVVVESSEPVEDSNETVEMSSGDNHDSNDSQVGDDEIVVVSGARVDSPDDDIEDPVLVPDAFKKEAPLKPKEKKFSRAVTKHKIKCVSGWGKGSGEGVYVEDIDPKNLDSTYAGKIITTINIPEQVVLFKASAIGIEGIVACNGKKQDVEALKKSFDGKAQIAFLLMSSEVDMKKLDGTDLEIVDETLMVAV